MSPVRKPTLAGTRWSRRDVLITGVAAVGIAPLAGCGSGGTDSDRANGATGEITYSFWSSGADTQAPVRKLIAAFEKAHPNITVKPVMIAADQYQSKLTTELQGGVAPDVMSVSPIYFEQFAEGGQLLALDDLIRKDKVALSNIPQALIDEYTLKGKLYGLAQNFATIALWYNKRIFDAAHLDYPNGNWGWRDVQEAARKLRNKSKGIWGLPADGSTQEGYYNTVLQAGGEIISDDGQRSGLDQPGSIEGLQFWTDLQAAGVTPTYAALQETTADSLFASGKAAMIYGGPWHALEYHQAKLTDVDVAPLPRGTTGTRCVINGTALTVWANSKKQQAAWEFVKYASASKEGQLVFGASGINIPAYAGTQSAWLKAFPEYNLQCFVEAARQSQPYPDVHNGALWSADVQKALAEGWTGKIDIAAAARNAAKVMNKDLSKAS